MSSSIRVRHHFFTRSSRPSLLLDVTLHPATYRYSRSQQGNRTRVESDIPLHPRIFNSRSLGDFLRIRSICWSSIPSKYPLWSTPMVSSSSIGKPGDMTCSLTGVSLSPSMVLVVLKVVSMGQPFCNFSMLIRMVSREVVEILETSRNRRFFECC